MQYRVWGVRGSFPAVSESRMEYGGNTSCFSVLCGDILVVFDAGSGLAELGGQLMKEPHVIRSIHILISHTHLDHIVGLYLFLSQIRDRFELHIYGGAGIAKALEDATAPAYWPCSVTQSGAAIHSIEPGGGITIGDGAEQIRVSSMAGTHPGGCLWYRLEWGGRSAVYMLDCEIDESVRPEMLRFAQNGDLLVWDANDAPGQEKKGWGHSTWEQGISFALEAGAERILMAHYGWSYEDEFLRRMEADAARKLRDRTAAAPDRKGLSCIFAKEGMVIEI